MDAERVGQIVPVGKLANTLEVAPVDGRDDDLGDAGGTCALDDGVAIGVELGGVEMAMRVDPHGSRRAAPSEPSPRGDATNAWRHRSR